MKVPMGILVGIVLAIGAGALGTLIGEHGRAQGYAAEAIKGTEQSIRWVPPMGGSVQITLAWDAKPAGQNWKSLSVYETDATGEETLVQQMNCLPLLPCPTMMGITTTNEVHVYRIRSWDGTQESIGSEPIVVNDRRPKTPTGFKFLPMP